MRRTERNEEVTYSNLYYYLHQIAFWNFVSDIWSHLFVLWGRSRIAGSLGNMAGCRGIIWQEGCTLELGNVVAPVRRGIQPFLSDMVCGSILHLSFCLYSSSANIQVCSITRQQYFRGHIWCWSPLFFLEEDLGFYIGSSSQWKGTYFCLLFCAPSENYL